MKAVHVGGWLLALAILVLGPMGESPGQDKGKGKGKGKMEDIQVPLGSTASPLLPGSVVQPTYGTGGKRVHGNNGVGNGIDPPPPGNPPLNDGPGTGPGHPGNKGGVHAKGKKG